MSILPGGDSKCWGKSYRRATLYGSRANASSKGSEEQRKYANLALAEIDSVDGLLNPDEDKEMFLNMLVAKAFMMSMTNQPEKTINVTEEVLSLNRMHPGVLDLKTEWQAQRIFLRKRTRIVANGMMR